MEKMTSVIPLNIGEVNFCTFFVYWFQTGPSSLVFWNLFMVETEPFRV